MDFSGAAGQESPSSVIPKGQLAWVIISFRGLKDSQTGGRYLDLELTVDDGQPFARKKLWDKLGDPFHPGNSDAYKDMGMRAICRILETGRNAGPHNPAGYQMTDFSQLDGLRVAVKIGIEAGTDGYADKNRVAEWLTPNPESKSGNKDFAKLVNGQFNTNPQPAQPATQSAFGFPAATQPQPAQPQQPQPQQQVPAQPAQPQGFTQGQQAPQPNQPAPSAVSWGTGAAGGASASTASPSNQPAPSAPGWLQSGQG